MPMIQAAREQAGQIAYFPRLTAPEGWLKANGAAVAQADYGALFSAIGFSLGWEGEDAATALPAVRHYNTVTLLSDGRVLVVGGNDGAIGARAETWIGEISGTSITWTASTALPSARYAHTSTLLSDGRVLVIGGNDAVSAQDETWIGEISGTSITWTASTALPGARNAHSACRLGDGRILVVAGHDGVSVSAAAWIGEIAGTSITWTASTALPSARYAPGAVVLNDGRVLVVGGHDGGYAQDETWIGEISGASITWTASTALPAARHYHSMTKMGDGRVLVAGGHDGAIGKTETWIGEIDGAGITWTSGAALSALSYAHGAEVAGDGRLLLVGGSISGSPSAAARFLADSFYLPDLRGEFVRGLDDGRGVDSARALGSAQAAEMSSHRHQLRGGGGAIGSMSSGGYANAMGANTPSGMADYSNGSENIIGATGGTETRPRNVALLACIKY